MNSVARAFLGAFLVMGSVVAVSTSWAIVTAIPLLAAHTTALIMGGTAHPLVGPKEEPDFVTSYLDTAMTGYLEPAFDRPVTNAVAVFTPAEFFPVGRLTLDKSVAEGRANLHRCVAAGADCAFNGDGAVAPGPGPSVAPAPGDSFLVFGFSQSSMIASLAKQDLIRDYEAGDPVVPFLLVANPMRPNGGVLMRGKGLPTIPILGISFTGASPTDSQVMSDGTYAYPTVDIARQYDGLGGDFPVRPLNLLALVNALLGYGLLHGETVDVPFDQARYQGREGDTSYYLIETDIVPILQPLAFFIPKPILKAIDAPLRVIIEDAYDRSVGPGTPLPLSWWPINDVLGLVGNLIKSVPVAVDNLSEGFGLPRVLGTEATGTYGVGGPDLPDDPDVAATDVSEPPQEVVQQPEDAAAESRLSTEYVESEADPMTEADGVVQERAEPAATGEEATSMATWTDSDEPAVDAYEFDPEESTSTTSPGANPELHVAQADSDAGGTQGEADAGGSEEDSEAGDSEADAA